jgi:hypothetical protein
MKPKSKLMKVDQVVSAFFDSDNSLDESLNESSDENDENHSPVKRHIMEPSKTSQSITCKQVLKQKQNILTPTITVLKKKLLEKDADKYLRGAAISPQKPVSSKNEGKCCLQNLFSLFDHDFEIFKRVEDQDYESSSDSDDKNGQASLSPVIDLMIMPRFYSHQHANKKRKRNS